MCHYKKSMVHLTNCPFSTVAPVAHASLFYRSFSCLNCLISFALSLIFQPFVPLFSNHHLPLHSNNHHLLNFKHAATVTIHINTMDNHEYTNKSNSTKARIKRKRIMQQKCNTQVQFPVQPTIHPAPQNQLYSDVDLCSTNLHINENTSVYYLAPATEYQSKEFNISFRMNNELTLPNYYLSNF